MKTIPKQFPGGMIIALIWTVVAVLPYGCSNNPVSEFPEGKVIYDVSIDNADINPMMKAMMPSEVVTYFSGSKTSTVISAGMNMMKTRLISDAQNYKFITIIDAMGKKVAMVLDKKQVEEKFLDRVDLKVRHTSETKIIAGLTCKQAIITDSTENSYPVYYTEAVAVNQPNWSSPFRDIEGLLMEYSIRFGDIVMNLKAKEIVNTKNEQSHFEIPEGYEIITDPSQLNFSF